MKKLFIFLLLLIGLRFNASAQQNFEVMTPKPTPGSVITIEYMPRNTVLQGVKGFEATAYLLEGSLPLARAITLTQEGGLFRGTVKTNDTTKAVFFSFAKDDKRDNNNDEGYYTSLYDKSGAILAGSQMAMASGFSNYGGIWGLKRNVLKATELNKKEFSNAAAREKYYMDYLNSLSPSTDAGDKELLKAALEKKAAQKDISEADLLRVKNLYEFSLKDKDQAVTLMATIKQRFPSGTWKRTDAINAFFKSKDVAEKDSIYQAFINNFGPFIKTDQSTLDGMTGQLALLYANAGNYEAAKKYLAAIQNKASKANTLNSIAWKLSGEGLSKKPIDVKTGLELSKQSLALMEEEKKNTSGQPSYLTEQQYVKNLDNSYYLFADTYATLLYHNNNYNEAYAVEKAAIEHFKQNDVDMNESFALLTEKVKGAKEAQAQLESFFEKGRYSPAMKEQLQRLYIASGKSEAQWTVYANNLEERAFAKLKANLVKTMINVPAPQFALKDLNGNKVALSSLKGKIVVVDFWATWCGPCMASFPGMQTAVNKYKDNKDVVFLFIDTWENDSNRVQKVTGFIAKNNYTFNVLYDDAKAKEGNTFVVVDDYKVEGIPTKFVIDRDSNIRFKTVGYSGNADELTSEISAMIDMAAGKSEPVKKAF